MSTLSSTKTTLTTVEQAYDAFVTSGGIPILVDNEKLQDNPRHHLQDIWPFQEFAYKTFNIFLSYHDILQYLLKQLSQQLLTGFDPMLVQVIPTDTYSKSKVLSKQFILRRPADDMTREDPRTHLLQAIRYQIKDWNTQFDIQLIIIKFKAGEHSIRNDI